MSVRDRLQDIVCEQMNVEVEAVQDDTRFYEDLNIDSLDAVELVMEVEDEFEISISDEEAARLTTFGQAVAFVQERVGQQ